jgi:hypothetical protein
VAGGSTVRLRNNLLVGPGDLTSGRARARANLRVGIGSFVAPGREDFRLRASTRAVDRGRTVPRRWRARWEYVSPTGAVRRPTVGPTDLGAFERR